MKEVTLEQRLELAKRRRQQRGQHLKENHPLHRMGPHLGRGRGKGHPLPKGSLLGREGGRRQAR